MRKVLVGALIVCLSLGLATIAMAAEISWSGSVDFGITGESGGSVDILTGWELDVSAADSSGPWSATVAFANDAGAFDIDDAYIEYAAEAFTLQLNPVGVGNDLYDLAVDDDIDLTSNPGISLTIPMETFSFSLVGNKASGADTYNFGAGVDFSMDNLGFGLIFNSDQESAEFDSSYAGKISYTMDALTLTGEYGAVSGGTLDGVSRYYAELGYTLTGGSVITLSYLGSSEDLSEIYAELSTPIAEKVDFIVDLTSTTTGGSTTTEYEAYLEFSL
ncbi:hypothetical protein DRJ04_06980 [Candidatus Aerophobetes bacterium]|uniref:Uncharacterized protein n=1 Tax=Aerophobetes bacterium TaxID=2030807 RepID=A0A662DCG2_UNCAE|nr:MAG: hypothetical protein DRJ04_06980 [Candidatus Aerophobetes bacterium]